MPLKLQIPKLFQKPLTIKTHQISRLCTITQSPLTQGPANLPESPDGPTWLCNGKNTKLAGPDDLMPSLVNCVQNPNLETHRNVIGPSLLEPKVSDVDKPSEILKKRYPSEDAVVKALNECDINVTTDLVSHILKRFSNQWVLAFGVFTWAKNQTGYEHTPELYDSMVDVLGKCRKFGIMWELVDEMKGLDGYVPLVTIFKVMRRLGRDGKYRDAIDAFKGIEKFGLSKGIEALNALMDALVKEGGLKDAYSVFVEFKDSVPLNCHSFNILINGYCKARKLVEARMVMDEMERCGFRPDVVSYTCFVESYSKEKDFRNVNAIFNEMEEKGCKPNVITYTIFMHALGKANRIDEVFEVHEKMKRSGCALNAQYWSSFIHTIGKCGRIKDAWDVFEDMEKQAVSQNLLTYNTMISAACAHSQYKSAFDLLVRMEKDSCKPNGGTYGPLLKVCFRKNSMKVLKFLLSHMFKNNVSIDICMYTLLVNGFLVNEKLKHACFYFQEVVLKGMVPMDTTYEMLVKELERKNMAELKGKIEKLMLRAKIEQENRKCDGEEPTEKA